MTTALVFGAGGLFGAWEVGAWRALRERIRFDMVVGASAGAWVGWLVAAGKTPEEIAGEWLDPRTAEVLRVGLHRSGWLLPEGLHERARELYAAGPPQIPYALTVTEVPSMRVRVVRGEEVRWEHLAATCAIPLSYPPVRIDGKRYVDGGVKGALPLWVAEEMGAERAIGLNCLTIQPFPLLRKVVRARLPGASFEALVIEPSRKLGSLRDAVVWRAANIERWMEQGSEDALRALSSVRM